MIATRQTPHLPRVRSAVALAMLAMPSTTGCSFKVLRPPPPRSEWPDPVTPHSSQLPCTSTLAPPIGDSIAGGTFGTLAFVERGRHTSSEYFAPIAAAAAIPFVVSAIYGFFTTDRCREYQTLFVDAWSMPAVPAGRPTAPATAPGADPSPTDPNQK